MKEIRLNSVNLDSEIYVINMCVNPLFLTDEINCSIVNIEYEHINKIPGPFKAINLQIEHLHTCPWYFCTSAQALRNLLFLTF